MASNTQYRAISSGNRESQPGTGSQQQMNRGQKSRSPSNMSGTQSPSEHSGASIPGSLCDRVDIPGVISNRVDDTLPNPPDGPGMASSQDSNPVRSGTGSDGFRVTIPPPDSHAVWEGFLDQAVLEKLGSDRNR
jgi:hypothetical protein